MPLSALVHLPHGTEDTAAHDVGTSAAQLESGDTRVPKSSREQWFVLVCSVCRVLVVFWYYLQGFSNAFGCFSGIPMMVDSKPFLKFLGNYPIISTFRSWAKRSLNSCWTSGIPEVL